ncbi:hypothetical protein MAR_025713 [Mya arenaria]|uniref:Uncharacterized protein n=1 Tax=Mya arenaria TaxID=6604 RepID=A0ABY7ENG3_MYAAR|nr:uncharacterized protein LOC128242237 [Mya arenaria]WAR11533.1 hypothetical protein MAR_025713 [Mya arenaria]
METTGIERARRRHGYLAGVMAVLGIILLICGLLGALIYNKVDTIPYYVGGFSAGPLALIMSLASILISKCGSSNSSESSAMKHVLGAQWALSLFLVFGCFVGIVFASVGGIADSAYEGDPVVANKTIAVITLIACIITIIASIGSICLYCCYGHEFGLDTGKRSSKRRRRTFIDDNVVGPSPSSQGTERTSVHSIPTLPRTSQSETDMLSLQEQNRLLKEQIILQKKLQQQQQQQQHRQSDEWHTQNRQHQPHQQLKGGEPPPPYTLAPLRTPVKPSAPPPLYGDK